VVKRLVVGLGNPGDEYDNSPHNVGFAIIDQLHTRYQKPKVTRMKKFLCEAFECENTLFVKPYTFMNLSGECLGRIGSYFSIEPSNMLVIYDDIYIDAGNVRFRTKGSSGGHNGLKSVEKCLKTSEYPRLKVGVGPLPEYINMADYVTGKMKSSVRTLVENTIQLSAEIAEHWVKGNESEVRDFLSMRTQKI
jgi:PTH1 family peptidyl-tRNA hydrolase